MPVYRTEIAMTSRQDGKVLSEVLRDCPAGSRLHSVVPLAQGGGYTGFFYVIFESPDPTPSAFSSKEGLTNG